MTWFLQASEGEEKIRQVCKEVNGHPQMQGNRNMFQVHDISKWCQKAAHSNAKSFI